jgi:tRNA (adenine37-N6)-methyltransferase
MLLSVLDLYLLFLRWYHQYEERCWKVTFMKNQQLVLGAIGHIRSEFREKFGVPKQPGLAPALRAILELTGDWSHETGLKGLDECSHLWVIFHFHLSETFKGGTVRPPVLGGEKRMGVFATRSPHRPNPLGLSLVKVEKIVVAPGVAQIHVSGHDFVDGTPIFDIKPYVASYDVPQTPATHWSDAISQPKIEVVWKADAGEHKLAIEQVLALDPRPRVAKPDARFGLDFAGMNVVFGFSEGKIIVEEVSSAKTSPKIK